MLLSTHSVGEVNAMQHSVLLKGRWLMVSLVAFEELEDPERLLLGLGIQALTLCPTYARLAVMDVLSLGLFSEGAPEKL